MIAWYKYEDGKTFLTFIVQPQNGLTARLFRELRSGDSISFDGPYGQNLRLERYQTIILVSKGIGIAGVLPYAQHLLKRYFHNTEIKKQAESAEGDKKRDLWASLHRDATIKVDLLLKLDYNRQEEWMNEHLQILQEQDEDRVVLSSCTDPS
jgi:NAD(P)H-flavin reductase